MSPLVVSFTPRFILGLTAFGSDNAALASGVRITDADVADFDRQLVSFQGRGYNELDTTANVVNASQQGALSRAAAGWRERGLSLVTKVVCPTQQGVDAPAMVVESVEASLKALGTNCVNLLYLDATNRSTPSEPTLEAIDLLHKQGKFVQLGISNFDSSEVAEIVDTCRKHDWVCPTVYLAAYSYLARAIERELLPTCRRLNMELVAYNPLADGLLTGSSGSAGTAAAGRLDDGQTRALRKIKSVASDHKLDIAEIALRWLVNDSPLQLFDTDGNGSGFSRRDGVVIAASNSDELEKYLAYLEGGPLPDAILAAIKGV